MNRFTFYIHINEVRVPSLVLWIREFNFVSYLFSFWNGSLSFSSSWDSWRISLHPCSNAAMFFWAACNTFFCSDIFVWHFGQMVLFWWTVNQIFIYFKGMIENSKYIYYLLSYYSYRKAFLNNSYII